ncbi:hypothetical protein GGX14DRAFT_526959 [Mycena pura]|uniref:Ketoreductase (KR) domain-containing protein n=1 Tax=Mycena pura TaxID=153505 RepID=A0AAD6UW72_9AGAR|nr:hypothetical protein GGX14DRAFT_526959 [Mycena pura]
MVLKILASAAAYFPSEYTVHAVSALVAILAARGISQGRKTTRERDLHARVIILTGGFSPFGLTLLEALAQRGAHIIALTPHPIDSEVVRTYVELLRATTANEQIFAEQCDLASPPSVHAFAARFAKNEDQRLDAVVFAHEYRHVGVLRFLARRTGVGAEEREARERGALATFLLTTLLLPVMLTAPAERDIRIINVVNRFHAAAAPSFATDAAFAFSNASAQPVISAPHQSLFLAEGVRALRAVVVMRHLQRILDALPSEPPLPKPSSASTAASVPVVRPGAASQRSNIVAVSVSPGLSRAETMGPLLGASAPQSSLAGMIWCASFPLGSVCAEAVGSYALLYPFLLVFAKSAAASIQTVLHALFLPTPFKVLSTEDPERTRSAPEELLKPGALYAECAVVRVQVPSRAPEADDADLAGETKIPDDGELGGEAMGRRVWEAYEAGLKAWNAAHPVAPAESDSVGSAGAGIPPAPSI